MIDDSNDSGIIVANRAVIMLFNGVVTNEYQVDNDNDDNHDEEIHSIPFFIHFLDSFRFSVIRIAACSWGYPL